MKYLVLAITAVLSAQIIWKTHRYSVDMPFSDDFAFVSRITGEEPVTLAWLWEAHNEHRMIVPKLVDVLATRAAGMDFRAVAHVSVVAVALVAWLTVATVARLRGRYAIEDILVAAVVCTWSQAEALTWTAPFNLVATTAALLVWWAAASRGWIGTAAAATVMLALTGASGVAALAGIVPWLGYTALRQRARGPKLVASAAAFALVAYGGLCAMTYTRGVYPSNVLPRGFALRYFVRLLASPYTLVSGLQDTIGLIVIGITGWLIASLVRERRTVLDAAPTLALLIASLAIAAAVTIGRAPFGTLDISSRYVTLLTPLAVAILALIAMLPARRAVVLILATVVIASFSLNEKLGNAAGSWLHNRLTRARVDIGAGVSLSDVVELHGLYPETAYGVAGLCALERARGSVFAKGHAPSHPECAMVSPTPP